MLARPIGFRLAAAAATLGLALSAAACGSDSDSVSASESISSETRVFAADNGDIEIPVAPQRIVATGYAVPPLIESDAPLVGISEWKRGIPLMTPDDLAEYESLEKIAGDMSAADTNYEAIARVDPDLIVIGVPQPAMVDLDLGALEAIAPVVAIGPTNPAAWSELTERQLDAVGQLDSYEANKATYDEKAAGIKEKYAGVLGSLEFGHLGAYGESAAGNFQREFAGSWGTNIAQDVGVNYYGEVKEKLGGSQDSSEYPAIENIPESFADADVITYTVEPDGSVGPEVQYVLDSELFKTLPAVRAGKVYGLRYTEAATYTSALQTLDAIDEALAPLLTESAGPSSSAPASSAPSGS